MVCLPLFPIFNVRTDVDACVCTRGLYGHRKKIGTGSWLWEKNHLLYRGLEPVSVMRIAFQWKAVPTELSLPQTVDKTGSFWYSYYFNESRGNKSAFETETEEAPMGSDSKPRKRKVLLCDYPSRVARIESCAYWRQNWRRPVDCLLDDWSFSCPVFQKFPQLCLWNGSNVRLIDDGPLSSFQGRSSSTSSFNASLLQAIDGVMSLVLYPQVVSQAP